MAGFQYTYEFITLSNHAEIIPAFIKAYEMDISAIVMGMVTYGRITDKDEY